MASTSIGQAYDETELESELEQLQQEQLDEQMLKTGTVPVADAVHKMPSPANAERKSLDPSNIPCQRTSPAWRIGNCEY